MPYGYASISQDCFRNRLAGSGPSGAGEIARLVKTAITKPNIKGACREYLHALWDSTSAKALQSLS